MGGSNDATGSDKSAKGAGSSKPAKTASSGQPPAKAAGAGQPPAKTAGANPAPPKPNTANPPPANSARRAPTPETSQSDSKKRAASPNSAGPSSGASRPFSSGKVAMRLFTRDTKFSKPPSESEKLEPGPLLDERSKLVLAHCFHVALALLESSTGHDAFIEVAKRIATHRREEAKKNNKPEEGLYAGKKIEEMPVYVNGFLKKVREIGLAVCVSRGIKGHYGLSQRLSWGFNMDKYDPKTAAIVYLNKGMVEGLLEAADAVQNAMAQQSNINADIEKKLKKADAATTKELQLHRTTQEYAQMSFDRGVLCVAVTIAHEIVHCGTGFLSGRTGVRTPPLNPPLGPYGNADEGEAGWEWCNRTFGGLAHFFYTKGSPEPFKSGYYIGIPAILVLSKTDWETKSKMYTVDHAIVKKIIEMKDWASAYKADPKWMHKIRAQGDQGILYPEWKTTYNAVTKIWDKYYGIPDVASGKTVEMGQEADIKFASALSTVEKQITRALAATDIPKPVRA